MAKHGFNPSGNPLIVVLLPEHPVQCRKGGEALSVQEIIQRPCTIKLLSRHELLGDHVTCDTWSTSQTQHI